MASGNILSIYELRYYTGLEFKAKEAYDSKSASSCDFIDFKCPHNSSSSKGHTSMEAIGGQDQCALSSFPTLKCDLNAHVLYIRGRWEGMKQGSASNQCYEQSEGNVI